MSHHYSKLVRDNVPDLIRKKGGTVTTHNTDTDEEYWHKLKEKLQEEMDEFSKNETIENLADILEVLDAIIVFKEYDKRDIQVVKDHKAAMSGKFEKRVILDLSDTEVGTDIKDQLI